MAYSKIQGKQVGFTCHTYFKPTIDFNKLKYINSSISQDTELKESLIFGFKGQCTVYLLTLDVILSHLRSTEFLVLQI